MRRTLKRILFGIFSAAVFAVALFAGVVVHFHLPVVREAIASELNHAFASAFAGDVRVVGLESIGADGVRARELVADDPDGVRVLRASGIALDASLFEITRAAVFGGRMVVDRAHVADADMSLDEDARGLRVARAFAPRTPSPGRPSTLELTVHGVAIDHAWVHGAPSGQIVDADVRRLGAEIVVTRGDLAIDLEGADLDARAIPRAGVLTGHVVAELESARQLRAIARFSGETAGAELRATARVDGDRFAANAMVPGAPAATIRALVPGAPIHEGASTDALVEGTARALAFRATGTLGPASLAAGGTLESGHLRAGARASHLDVRAFAPSLRASDIGARATIDWNGAVASLHGTIDPPGGRATIAADLDPHAMSATVDADVRDARALFAPFFDTSKLAGHGRLDARAQLDRDRNVLGATATAHFEDVLYGPASAGVVQLAATANGPLASPAFDVDVNADRTVVPKLHIGSATARARGTLKDARVALHLGGNAPFDVTARATIEPNAVALDDLDVQNAGTSILRGAIDWNRGALRTRLVGSRIDLASVRDTLGLEPALAGTLALDVDATLQGKSLIGRAKVDARGLAIDRFDHLDAFAALSNLDGAYAIDLRARTPRHGWLSVASGDLRLAGPALERASWEHASGTLSVDGTLRVAELAALAHRPSPLDGWARIGMVAQRHASAGPPDLRVSVASSSLALGKKGWPLALDARAHLDPAGALDAHVDVAHRAEHGKLELTSNLAWDDLVAGRLPDFATLPFTADLDVPAFDTSEACRDLGVRCRGTIAAAAHAVGPVDGGHATIAVTVAGFRSPLSPIAELADASLVGSFNRRGGKAHLAVSHFGSSARELEATAVLQVPADPRAWSASLEARLNGLPIRVPPVANAASAAYATVTGTATIHDYHRDARARLDLRADDLGWSDVKTDRWTLAGEYDGRALSLAATLRARASSASLSASAPAVWGAALAPSLASSAPLRLAARADDLQLDLLEPILPLSVGSVSGRLDADASLSVQRDPMRVTAHGWAKVADAKIESSAVGTIQDLAATVRVRDDGTIALENAHFRGTRGKVTLTGKALAPGGELRSIDLGASIDKNDPFPLVVSGQRIGDVWGKLDASARPSGGGFDVKLGVPSLHVQLPDVSHGTPESLDVAKNVTIGVRRNGVLVPVELAPPSPPPGNPIPIRVEIALGNDVRIARDDNLSASLRGRPVVTLGRETRVVGVVVVAHGMIDIEGKRFAIEHGTLTFDGNPSNPLLAVTAAWTASDRTKVIARYVGRASEGKLELTSDPPHTKDEIVALLVFGSAGGPTAGSGGTTGAVAAATAVGGASFATQPFNKALEQLTHIDIKTRVDTSGSAAKSEVEVQIAKHIWAQIAYVLGLPPPGTEPDRTWLTLAWYATARWSFDFTVGDHGSTVIDALWQRRY